MYSPEKEFQVPVRNEVFLKFPNIGIQFDVYQFESWDIYTFGTNNFTNVTAKTRFSQ